MTRKGVGFAALKQIKPETAPQSEPADSTIDMIAAQHGFPSREAIEKITKRESSSEPTANLVMRPKVSVFNKFVQFSKENRYSYPEALDELMKRANI